MDAARFDRLTKRLSETGTRRSVLGLLSGLLVAVVPGASPEAARRRHKRKRQKRHDRRARDETKKGGNHPKGDNHPKGGDKKGGKDPHRVPVCHNGRTIEVAASALQGVLRHGGYEGPCAVPPDLDCLAFCATVPDTDQQAQCNEDCASSECVYCLYEQCGGDPNRFCHTPTGVVSCCDMAETTCTQGECCLNEAVCGDVCCGLPGHSCEQGICACRPELCSADGSPYACLEDGGCGCPQPLCGGFERTCCHADEICLFETDCCRVEAICGISDHNGDARVCCDLDTEACVDGSCCPVEFVVDGVCTFTCTASGCCSVDELVGELCPCPAELILCPEDVRVCIDLLGGGYLTSEECPAGQSFNCGGCGPEFTCPCGERCCEGRCQPISGCVHCGCCDATDTGSGNPACFCLTEEEFALPDEEFALMCLEH